MAASISQAKLSFSLPLWLSVVSGFFLCISNVSAVPWAGPHETVSGAATADWTPAPTGIANINLHHQELQKRDLYPANLCGWQGPNHVGAYCGIDSSCAWFTNYKYVGCCNTGLATCDGLYTSCIDWRTAAMTVSNPAYKTCTGNNYCYLNNFPNGYHQWGCGSTSTGETVVTSWTGMNPGFSIFVVSTGQIFLDVQLTTTIKTSTTVSSTQPPTSTVITPPTDQQTQTSTSSTVGFVAETATTSQSSRSTVTPLQVSPVPVPDPPDPSTGAKIGIAVAIAVAVLVGLSLACWFRKRRIRNRSLLAGSSTPHFHSPMVEQSQTPAATYQSSFSPESVSSGFISQESYRPFSPANKTQSQSPSELSSIGYRFSDAYELAGDSPGLPGVQEEAIPRPRDVDQYESVHMPSLRSNWGLPGR